MSLIVESAKDLSPDDGWGGSFEHPCEGSRHHSPTPLRTYPVYLSQVVSSAVAGDATDTQGGEDQVWLCSTCEDNLQVFCTFLHSTNGALVWDVKREFGNIIRDLGQRAWAHYKGEPRG
jgi:hypothetical protein